MNRFLIIHYIGQYLFISLLIIELALLYHSNFPIYQDVGPINVKAKKESSKFDSENPPFIISHFTDTHVNTYNSLYESHFVKCLNVSLLFEPDLFLHTGDAVDDFCTDKRPKYGDQCSNDFEILNRILANTKGSYKRMIGNAGNHDMFGIYSFDSPNFHFLKTMRQFYTSHPNSIDEFLVSNTPIDVGGLTINFISMNPFRFPTLHPSFMYFAHTWRPFLDRLERVVSEVPQGQPIVFHSHYPLDMYTGVSNPYRDRVSSSGRTAADLIETPRTVAFISGHLHPEKAMIERHGGFVESIGADMKSRPTFVVASIDNGRVAFNPVDAEKPPECIVTYPVASNQTCEGAFIDDDSAMLRILCRGEHRIELHGDVECDAVKLARKVKENVYLYEHPLKKIFEDDANTKSSGPIKHHITFGGGFTGEIDFYSGGRLPAARLRNVSGYSCILVFRFALPLIASYFLYVTWPSSSQSIKSRDQSYFSFMQKQAPHSSKNWFLTVSSLCNRLKIQRLQKRLRLALFAASAWPLILPLSLVETEGHLGFISTYGVFIGGEFRYSEHGQDFAVYFYLFVVLPAVAACACLADDLPLFGAGGIEACVSLLIGTLLVATRVWLRVLFKSAGPFCEFVSVFTLGVFALFPFIIYSYYCVYKSRGNRSSEWYAEGMAAANSFVL